VVLPAGAGFPPAGTRVAGRDIHNAADRTLAPSTVTAADLRAHGMERVSLWGAAWIPSGSSRRGVTSGCGP
jgi:hypothetical protein